ncbi:MAG: reverse gyrase [Acidilobus sp.]
MPRLEPIYKGLCPNCGREISAERLARGLPCAACLPEEPKEADPITVWNMLKARGVEGAYMYLYLLEKAFKDFSSYFEDKYGFSLSSAQRSWARRLLRLESFSIVAPTGVGKTTLLMAYAAYRADVDNWRILYLVPTENLVAQTAERLMGMAREGSVAYYYSSMKASDREAMLKRIGDLDYRILVVTPGFLVRNFDALKKASPYNLIVVDDVDSLLRNSKNIDRTLVLLGFSEEAVNLAFELVQLRLELARALKQGLQRRADELMNEIAQKGFELSKLKEVGVGQGGESTSRGQLVIASATGRPKGVKHLVFREMLGFEVGGGTDYLRNVIDSYVITDDVFESTVSLVKSLGRGGLVFVSQSLGKSLVKVVTERLKQEGVRALHAISNPRRAVEKLQSGEIDVAVGVASRYGALVRGIDLPEVIRYAVFVGVPATRLDIKTALLSPRRLLRALMFAEEKDKAFSDLRKRLEDLLRRYGAETQIVAAVVRGQLEAHGRLEELKNLVLEGSEKVASFLEGILPEEGQAVKIGTMVVRRESGSLWLYSPDAPTYIQASGRTSRLYHGAMTRGLSIVVDRIPELVEALQDRLRWISQAEFVPFESLNVREVEKELEESRKESVAASRKINVVTELIIVESPTKAKTIANFWGRPARRREGNLNIYETTVVDNVTNTVHLITVTASKGHVFDLVASPEKGTLFGVKVTKDSWQPIYISVKRCLDCGYQFAEDTNVCPRCGSARIVDSLGIVETLRKIASEVDRVIIMTDPDREGEKIAWDLYLALRPYNSQVYRSAFHEVTPRAFMEALRTPGQIQQSLVDAQIARRIDDRWIGFITSQFLWSKLGKNWLGAGRVQTPVLGWVIERYSQYKDNLGYKVRVVLPSGTPVTFYTQNQGEAEEASQAQSLTAVTEKIWTEEVNPQPPFTTDELIFEASARLGYSAPLTMKLAQDLFYSGLITYHRTDSTRISDAGIAVARQYLEAHGLAQYFKPRTWGTGGAHEAIRPTRPMSAEEVERAVLDGSLNVPMQLTGAHYRLYQLIFERFIASQMAPATLEKAAVKLTLGALTTEIEATIGILKEGFTVISRPRLETWVQRDIGKEYQVPVTNVKLFRGSLVQLFRSGDLVMLMRKKNIGRPSTYAKVIESNLRHGYIIESKKSKFIIPTNLGRKVYEILMSSPFAPLLTEEESARLEDALDKIEAGQQDVTEFVAKVRDEILEKAKEAGFDIRL